MTADVKFDAGQKQLVSEFDLHCGIVGSHVLRQDGRSDGQGASTGMGAAEDEARSTDVESVLCGGAKVVAGEEFGAELE